jgi:hypothetical protein
VARKFHPAQLFTFVAQYVSFGQVVPEEAREAQVAYRASRLHD